MGGISLHYFEDYLSSNYRRCMISVEEETHRPLGQNTESGDSTREYAQMISWKYAKAI